MITTKKVTKTPKQFLVMRYKPTADNDTNNITIQGSQNDYDNDKKVTKTPKQFLVMR